MDSLKIKKAVMRFFLYDKKHPFVVPNLMFGEGESDLISVTKTGYMHEIEIKISRSDFKADAKKHKWTVYEEAVASGKKTHPRWDTPNYFWYCYPEGLIEESEVDPKFGILVLRNDNVRIVRDAPRYGNKKVSRRIIDQIARSLSFKLYNALKLQK